MENGPYYMTVLPEIFLQKKLLIINFTFAYRDRPAAIPIHVKSIDDTSNFDEFPESELDSSKPSQ